MESSWANDSTKLGISYLEGGIRIKYSHSHNEICNHNGTIFVIHCCFIFQIRPSFLARRGPNPIAVLSRNHLIRLTLNPILTPTLIIHLILSSNLHPTLTLTLNLILTLTLTVVAAIIAARAGRILNIRTTSSILSTIVQINQRWGIPEFCHNIQNEQNK